MPVEKAEITSVFLVMSKSLKPLKRGLCQLERLRIAGRLVNRDAGTDGKGDPMRVFRLAFKGLPGTVGAVEPTTRIVIPHQLAKVAKAMGRGLSQQVGFGIGATCLRHQQRLASLKLEKLLVWAARSPRMVEVAEKSAICAIQAARKPWIENMSPKLGFEVVRRQFLRHGSAPILLRLLG